MNSSTIHKPIRKAVFPVAGMGTRFLPATKAIPKEMLTVVDRPVVQHVVDEARAADWVVLVNGRFDAELSDLASLPAGVRIETLAGRRTAASAR